jgi:hypothetical protein
MLNILKNKDRNKHRNKDRNKELYKLYYKINNNLILNCIYYKNLSFTENKEISNKIYNFNSSSATIIKTPNQNFLLNVRNINYFLDKNGQSIMNGSNKIVTINTTIILDSFFNIIEKKDWIPYYQDIPYIGIEDIRLFNFNNEIFFIGCSYNKNSNKVEIVSNKYEINNDFIPLFIKPNFVTNLVTEKNWVFFNNNNDINVIYKWSPIYICKINYETCKLELVNTNSQVPDFFSKLRGSTNGIDYDNKIWFICHIQIFGCYLHIFVVFDKNMKLLGYSNFFNFEKKKVEYCIGMITNNNNFIITYSTLDKTTKLCIFPFIFVNNLIQYLLN